MSIVIPLQLPAYSKPGSCTTCRGFQWPDPGFMPAPVGTGANGVLLIGEALGEQEALVGKPFVGRAGEALSKMLARRGLRRDDFLIDNTLRCRPPDNKLPKDRAELLAVVQACAPFLDATIADPRVRAIVPMGAAAAHRMLGPHVEEGIQKLRGYVEWRNDKWVIPTYHPAYIMRGNQRLSGVFLHDLERAIDIAKEGYEPHHTDYSLDVSPGEAAAWADRYEQARAADPQGTWLAYDIETPTKASGADEGELEFDDPTYLILRIGFSYREGDALSIPWSAEYIPTITRLLAGAGIKLVWNGAYDNPRLRANGLTINGPIWDIMWGWHILNSALEKGLAFVSTFYCPDQPRWKHLAGIQPAYYNAVDAEVTWRIAKGVVKDLQTHRQWAVFERHHVMLEVPLLAMTLKGVPLDDVERRTFSAELATDLTRYQAEMEVCVPSGARRFKDLTRPPATDDRQVELIRPFMAVVSCPGCGELKPKKAHFKLYKRKVNPCADLTPTSLLLPQPRWRRFEPFVPSNIQMQAYQRSQGHDPVTSRDRDRKITFDEDALRALMRRYRADPLYPRVLQYREVEKLLGTYVGRWECGVEADAGRWVGGMPVAADGRVHTTYTHTPSTLRLSSQSPNLQNIPRGTDSLLQRRVKALFVAEPGSWLLEVDYAAIEAKLVGYFARSRDFMRLATLGVHDYLNSFILQHQGKISQTADIGWSDADLKAMFADLKQRFPAERDISKTTVYLSLYGGTPSKIYGSHPEIFKSLKEAATFQRLFFEVCPDVQRWQHATVTLAEKQGYLRNPFGYQHRFWQVLSWTKRDGEWLSEWGEDAKAALAFMPQSTASGIIAEAILRIWYERDPEVGALLRLQIHDSLVSMIPQDRFDALAPIIWQTMEMPNPELPLDKSWGMGEYLAISTEAKVGTPWSELKKVA